MLDGVSLDQLRTFIAAVDALAHGRERHRCRHVGRSRSG